MLSSTVPRIDLILSNGALCTQDRSRPRTTALAVAGRRIAAVGSDTQIQALAGRQTERIDLHGGSVLPGMTDAHCHFYEWALQRRRLDLSGAASIEEMHRQVAASAASLPQGRWLLGQGWNEGQWAEGRMPDRETLDAAAPDHPVILWRCDMHLAAANSKALAAAGIDANTPDPPEGRIARDAAGRPTGILRELAINLVRDRIPPPTDAQLDQALAEAVAAAHRVGLTGIHDIRLMNDADGARAFGAFQRLRQNGRLDLRCAVALSGEQLDEAVALGLRTGFGDDRLRIGHVKFFADGGIGARTAWMLEPFLDAGSGMPLSPPAELAAAARRAEAAGLAVMIHAIGDRAAREVISLFASLQKQRYGPPPPVAHRIEHVQTIHPDDLPRLAALDVAACLTPENMVLDINTVDAALGDRGRRAYALRDIVDTGIPVMFSSDSPVCTIDPLEGMRAAVTRTRPDGTPQGGWYPQSRVSLAEAVAAYTRVPAEVHGRGHELGVLAPGYLADLVAFDRDMFALEPAALVQARVDLTVFDGKIVYRRK